MPVDAQLSTDRQILLFHALLIHHHMKHYLLHCWHWTAALWHTWGGGLFPELLWWPKSGFPRVCSLGRVSHLSPSFFLGMRKMWSLIVLIVFKVFWTSLERVAFLKHWFALGGKRLFDAMQVWHLKKMPLCMIHLKCQSFGLDNQMAHLSQEKCWRSVICIGSPERNECFGHFLPCNRRQVHVSPSGLGLTSLTCDTVKALGLLDVNLSFKNSSNSEMCVFCGTFFTITCGLHLCGLLEKSNLSLLLMCLSHLITAGSYLRNVLMAICQHAQLYKNCWDDPAPTAENQKQLFSCLHQENYNLFICHRPAAALGLAMVELVNGTQAYLTL